MKRVSAASPGTVSEDMKAGGYAMEWQTTHSSWEKNTLKNIYLYIK